MTKNEIKEAGFKSAMWFVEREIDEHYQTGGDALGHKAGAWYRRRNALNHQWHELDRYRAEASDACIAEILEALHNG